MNRRSPTMTTLILAIWPVAASISLGAEPLLLWYDQPAQKWAEALPLGNGHLGAMIFGDPTAEHLQLNENTVWSGQRHDNPRPEMQQNLPAVRHSCPSFQGRHQGAQERPQPPLLGHEEADELLVRVVGNAVFQGTHLGTARRRLTGHPYLSTPGNPRICMILSHSSTNTCMGPSRPEGSSSAGLPVFLRSAHTRQP